MKKALKKNTRGVTYELNTGRMGVYVYARLVIFRREFPRVRAA